MPFFLYTVYVASLRLYKKGIRLYGIPFLWDIVFIPTGKINKFLFYFDPGKIFVLNI